MRPVSEQFLRAVRGSHLMVARARICTSYQTGVNPAGTEVPILGGDVISNARGDVRSTLELLTDGTGWDTDPGQLFTPYGHEVFVQRGIGFGGGTVELVSQGYFRIYAVEQDEAPDGQLRISGRDRMSAIIEARLEAPVQFAAAVTIGDVFDTLVLDVLPEATIEFDDDTDTDTLGRAVVAERDRYPFLRDLVTSRGKVIYFDHRGVLVVASPPDPAAPVFEVGHARDGVLVSPRRALSREGVFNAVVATGEATDTDTAVRGVARDMNPNSPTLWGGPFGKVPRFHASPFYTTTEQARGGALSILAQSLGLPYSVDMAAVPNPALEVLDPVRVTYTGRRSPEIHVLDRTTVPLVAERAMTAATREQTDLQIEVT